MKNIRITALKTRRKIKAIKRRSGKIKNPRLAKTPTNSKNANPVKNSFMLFKPGQSGVLPSFYYYNN